MYLKKESEIRKGQAIAKYTQMLFRPTVITVLVIILWFGLQRYGIHFSEKSTDFIAIVEVILVIPFGLLATVALNTAQDKHDNIVTATFDRNKLQFLRYRDEKILIGMHVIMITFAGLIIFMAAMLDFKNPYEGLAIVTAVTFAFTLIWEVIRQLENPKTSHWIVERIPADWFEADVDDAFRGGEKSS